MEKRLSQNVWNPRPSGLCKRHCPVLSALITEKLMPYTKKNDLIKRNINNKRNAANMLIVWNANVQDVEMDKKKRVDKKR